jgi:hypothetical protein
MDQRERKHEARKASSAHRIGGIAGAPIHHDGKGFHWYSRRNMQGGTISCRLTAEAGKVSEIQGIRVFGNHTQRAMGHKNINSTVAYLSFVEDEIDAAILAS